MKKIATPHFDFESKKEYINPEMEVVKIVTHGMLATSPFSGDPTNPTPGDAGGAAAPEFDDVNMFGF